MTDKTLTIELANPVEFANATYDKLELREPTAGEMVKSLTQTGLASTIALISLVSGVPRGAVEKMPISEVLKADDFLSLFTRRGPATGES